MEEEEAAAAAAAAAAPPLLLSLLLLPFFPPPPPFPLPSSPSLPHFSAQSFPPFDPCPLLHLGSRGTTISALAPAVSAIHNIPDTDEADHARLAAISPLLLDGQIDAGSLEASLGAIPARSSRDGDRSSFKMMEKIPRTSRSARVSRKEAGRKALRPSIPKIMVSTNGIDPGGAALRDESPVTTAMAMSGKKIRGYGGPFLSVWLLFLNWNSDGAYAVGLVLWMLLLLYLLGTTASDYFGCTLEKLSSVLNLSPPLAGVTLLAVGNGAPDVFSSVMAFVSSDATGGIGFGSVLGGALFITTVVAGAVAYISARAIGKGRRKRRDGGRAGDGDGDGVRAQLIMNGEDADAIGDGGGREAEEESVEIDLYSFVRDIAVLLLSLAILTFILLDGKVYLREAIVFLAVYPAYVAVVLLMEFSHCRRRRASPLSEPLLKVYLQAPESPDSYPPPSQHPPHHAHSHDVEAELLDNQSSLSRCFHMLFRYCIEWPCAVPRRLTIPIIEADRWSRWQAVISCALAPVFATGVWILGCGDVTDVSARFLAVSVGISALVGLLLGVISFLNTESERPPQKFVGIWLAGAFFMSITWFYLVANELVVSLETLGTLLSISPAILAITFLAWGNSIGDLVADLALAFNDRSGAQIAISGCYAGPIFSIVLGLGLSFVICSWKCKPEPYVITRDDDDMVFFIIGFLAAGLIWGLVIMPCRGMKLNRTYGTGLVLIYCIFLIVGLVYTF